MIASMPCHRAWSKTPEGVGEDPGAWLLASFKLACMLQALPYRRSKASRATLPVSQRVQTLTSPAWATQMRPSPMLATWSTSTSK